MRKLSESQCLSKLSLSGASSLSSEELYRAAVFSANSGVLIAEAVKLGASEQLLLEARIMMSKGDLEKTISILNALNTSALSLSLQADVSFLKGMHAFRIGRRPEYYQFMELAKRKYLEGGDEYRALRSHINIEVIRSDKDSFECGSLKALFQEALRIKAHDLAGNIAKGEAVECLKRGELKNALSCSLTAIENYQLDGCPEDLSLTYVVAGIVLFLQGEIEKSQSFIDKAVIRQGKVKAYFEVWEALTKGILPKVPESHALAKVKWMPFLRKQGSITQKIVSALKEQPLTKVEIIERVWGKNAGGPSYEARFFSALQQLKKQDHVIIYDGEKYRVA